MGIKQHHTRCATHIVYTVNMGYKDYNNSSYFRYTTVLLYKKLVYLFVCLHVNKNLNFQGCWSNQWLKNPYMGKVSETSRRDASFYGGILFNLKTSILAQGQPYFLWPIGGGRAMLCSPDLVRSSLLVPFLWGGAQCPVRVLWPFANRLRTLPQGFWTPSHMIMEAWILGQSRPSVWKEHNCLLNEKIKW